MFTNEFYEGFKFAVYLTGILAGVAVIFITIVCLLTRTGPETTTYSWGEYDKIPYSPSHVGVILVLGSLLMVFVLWVEKVPISSIGGIVSGSGFTGMIITPLTALLLYKFNERKPIVQSLLTIPFSIFCSLGFCLAGLERAW